MACEVQHNAAVAPSLFSSRPLLLLCLFQLSSCSSDSQVPPLPQGLCALISLSLLCDCPGSCMARASWVLMPSVLLVSLLVHLYCVTLWMPIPALITIYSCLYLPASVFLPTRMYACQGRDHICLFVSGCSQHLLQCQACHKDSGIWE